MMGALNVCKQLGLAEGSCFEAMASFKGASRRLEKIFERDGMMVYKDFAHSPSKVRATVKAVKEQFKDYKVITGLELHTFSSLNKSFLAEYKHTMSGVDVAYVYFDPESVAHKNLEDLSEALVQLWQSEDYLRSIGEKLQNIAKRRYRWADIIIKYRAVIDTIKK